MEEIYPLHEKVRRYVEQEFPEYAVTRIHGYTDAHYEIPPQALGEPMPQPFLAATDARFVVEAWQRTGSFRLECEVTVTFSTTGKTAFVITRRPQVRV